MEIVLRIEDSERQKLEELNIEVKNKDILLVQVPRSVSSLGVRKITEIFKKVLATDNTNPHVVVLPIEYSISVLKLNEKEREENG